MSGRQVDLLVGPAGAGKTTAMHALKTAWTKAHGKNSVVGLAPSAVAAQVLAEDLGIGCENTAKWLHEYDRGRAQFRKGQLVIIDEATLAGTLTLDRLTALAAEAGAKVLLVGDWAQLQSVDAGGAFSLLASARPDTPELTEVHRFTHEWEKAASLDLRHGRAEVISTYVAKDRVQEGTTDEMMDAAYLAWAADVKDGRTSILVAEASEMVIAPQPSVPVPTASSPTPSATSRSTSPTAPRHPRVTSSSPGTTTAASTRCAAAGSATATAGPSPASTRTARCRSSALGVDFGGSVTLPAAYVAEHVDLGYAVTAHRAQGMTVDTSHVVVTGSTTRENFYVSMTRGRDSNIAYVALDKPDEGHAPPEPDEVNAHTVLYGVLQHLGGELSAHQMIVAEQERWSSIAQLGAEYETIGAVAQRDRWVAAIKVSGLTEAQVEQVLTSPSFGPLTAELRRAESDHHDVERLLPILVARRSLDDAEDIGAVLISRVQKAAQPKQGKRRPSPKLVVGLIPVADGPMSPEMAKVLSERCGPDGRTGDGAGREGRRGQGAVVEATRHGPDDRGSQASLAPRSQGGRRLPRPLQRGRAQGSRGAPERGPEARRRPRRARDPPCPSHRRGRRERPGRAQPHARITGTGDRVAVHRGSSRRLIPRTGDGAPVLSDRRRREEVSPDRRRPSCSPRSGTSAPRFAATSASTCPPTEPSTGSAPRAASSGRSPSPSSPRPPTSG